MAAPAPKLAPLELEAPEDAAAPAPADAHKPAGAARVPRRLQMLAFCFSANLLCYTDRTNLSVAILPMADEFGWSATEVGFILSSFFYGYLVTQIPGGLWAQRFGAVPVLATGVLLWSLATLATPPAAALGIGPLVAVRVFMGLAEAVSMPTVHAILSKWFPAHERSRAVCLSTSGQFVGTCVAMLASRWADHGRWPAIFYVFGALGVAWAAVCWVWGASSPAQDARLGAVERAYLLAPRGGGGGGGGGGEEVALVGAAGEDDDEEEEEEEEAVWPRVRRFLRHKPVLAAICAHTAHNYGYYVLLGFLPTFFNDAMGVDVASVGAFAVLPYVAMAVADNAFGATADWLLGARGWPLLRVRRAAQMLAFLVPAGLFLLLPALELRDAWQAALLLSAALGLNSASHSGYWANLIDLGGPRAGLLCGVSNTVATLPGIVGPAVTGWLLDTTGSWTWIFVLVALNYGVGLVVFCRWSSVSVV